MTDLDEQKVKDWFNEVEKLPDMEQLLLVRLGVDLHRELIFSKAFLKWGIEHSDFITDKEVSLRMHLADTIKYWRPAVGGDTD